MSADNCIVLLKDVENCKYYVSSTSMSSWLELEKINEKIEFMIEFTDFEEFNNEYKAEEYAQELFNDLGIVEYGIIVEEI